MARKWRVADSLEVLFDEVNERWPGRSKRSDGTLGDAAHSSRKSDHNPNAAGVVCAADITDDEVGLDKEIADIIVATIIARRDPRVYYVIHEGIIWKAYPNSGKPAWSPHVYTGPNGHFLHVHVSVRQNAALYDDAAPWGILKSNEPDDPEGLTVNQYETLNEKLDVIIKNQGAEKTKLQEARGWLSAIGRATAVIARALAGAPFAGANKAALQRVDEYPEIRAMAVDDKA